jgi:hypothetical protein
MFAKIIKILCGIAIISVWIFLGSCGNGQHHNMHGQMMKNGGMMGNGTGDSSAYMPGMNGEYGQNQNNQEGQYEQNPLSLDGARKLATEYLKNTGSTTLKLGEGTEYGEYYEFPLIKISDNSTVAQLQVNKYSGKVRAVK